MKNNIIFVEFGQKEECMVYGLHQYDKGQLFQFEPGRFPDGTEIQFESGQTKLIVDDKVEIPNDILEKSGKFKAWIQEIDLDSETTIKTIIFTVYARSKKNDYIEPDNEQTFREQMQGILDEAKMIAESNKSDLSNKIDKPTGVVSEGQLLQVKEVTEDGDIVLTATDNVSTDTDTTLTREGVPADAKATGLANTALGRAIESLREAVSETIMSIMESVESIVFKYRYSVHVDLDTVDDDVEELEIVTQEELDDGLNKKVGYSEVVDGKLMMYSDDTKSILLSESNLPSGSGVTPEEKAQIQENTDGISRLSESIVEISDSVYSEDSDIEKVVKRYNMISPDMIIRGDINSIGTIVESESSARDVAKFIPVKQGKTYGITFSTSGRRAPLSPSRVVMFDRNKVFVEQAISNGTYTSFITALMPYGKNVWAVTSNIDGYLCLMFTHGYSEIMMFSDLSDEYVNVYEPSVYTRLKNGVISEEKLDKNISAKFNSVKDVNGIMDGIVNTEDMPYNLLNPTSAVLGTLNMQGILTVNSASVYLVSDFIFLEKAKVYTCTYHNANFNSRYALNANRWCFYDEENKYFKAQSTGLVNSPLDFIEYNNVNGVNGFVRIKSTENVYMRIQYGANLAEPQIVEGTDIEYIPIFEPVKKYGLKNRIVAEDNLTDELKAKIESGSISALDAIYKFAFCKVHKKTLHIGDSLTEGYHYSGDIRKSMSYPSHMASLVGYDVTNKGLSGITSLGWWNTYKDTDFTGYDAVFIYLGSNGGLTDTVDADTASGDYNTYASTNTGGYCAIVAKIRDVNPKAKIYIIQYNNVTVTSQVTAKIAQKYGCTTLMVSDTSVFTLTDSKYHTDATHYNSIGYWAFACVMLVQLEKYIAEHISEYTDLVGTGEIIRP